VTKVDELAKSGFLTFYEIVNVKVFCLQCVSNIFELFQVIIFKLKINPFAKQ